MNLVGFSFSSFYAPAIFNGWVGGGGGGAYHITAVRTYVRPIP